MTADPSPEPPAGVTIVEGESATRVAWNPVPADPDDVVLYQVHGLHANGTWVELTVTANLTALAPSGYGEYGVSVSVNGVKSVIGSNCLVLRPFGPGDRVSLRTSCVQAGTRTGDGRAL